MRFIQDLRKQSGWCRVLLLIGFLVFGTYLAFDVLDLDGSNLPSNISSNTFASLESTQTDAERLFRLDYSALATSRRVSFILILQIVTASQPSGISALTRILAVHHPQILGRIRLGPEGTASSSSTVDPA